jgi:RNA recognition motif-containing protein
VFVGSLSYQTSRDELVRLFSAAGNIVDAYLPTDRETGRPRGFAFVTFSTEAEAADAISRFNQHELNGRRLVVNAAEARPTRGPGGSPPPPRPSSSYRAPLPPPPMPLDSGEHGFRQGPSGRGYPGSRGNQMPPKAKGSRRGLRRRKRSL